MKKQKFYFRDEDAETCYTLDYHMNEAKEAGLEEIELVEAIPDFGNPEFTWCRLYDLVEKAECNKTCPDYNRTTGRFCENRGLLYEHGESVKFKVN